MFSFSESNHKTKASWGLGVTSVEMSNDITNIGAHAFSGTNLTSVDIPDSVTSISDYAFYLNANPQEITLGDSVASIGKSAFSGIPSNATIYCQEGSNKYNGKTCASVIASSGFQGTIQLYTKDEDGNRILYDKNSDGIITSNGKIYASVEDMLTALSALKDETVNIYKDDGSYEV